MYMCVCLLLVTQDSIMKHQYAHFRNTFVPSPWCNGQSVSGNQTYVGSSLGSATYNLGEKLYNLSELQLPLYLE